MDDEGNVYWARGNVYGARPKNTSRGVSKERSAQLTQAAFLKLEQRILERLSMCGGSLSLTSLFEELMEERNFGKQSTELGLREFLRQGSPHNARLFHLEDDTKRNECTVSVKTDVAICRTYNPRRMMCQQGPDCDKLHVCYYFIAGRCLSGRTCRHPHTLESEHNKRVLDRSGLGHLHDSDIIEILRKSFMRIDSCSYYNSSRGCNRPNCRFMHVCRHYIIGDCRFTSPTRPCKYSHDLKGPQALKVWNWYHIDALAKGQTELLRILQEANPENENEGEEEEDVRGEDDHGDEPDEQIRLPDICSFYNGKGCAKGKKCAYLHICRFFIFGKCKYAAKCQKSHEIKGPQPMVVWRKYPHVAAENKTEEQLVILIRKKICNENDDEEEEQGSHGGGSHGQPLPGGTANDKQDKNEICEYNLRRKCNFGDNCRKLHTEQNYQWQMKNIQTDQWTSFPASTNVAIETAFCDITVTELKFTRDGIYTAILDFKRMQRTHPGSVPFAIRRLETPMIKFFDDSSVDNMKKVMSTHWSWFWLDNGDVWVPYTSGLEIEEAYQWYLAGNGSTFKMERNQFEYALDFASMRQKNTQIGTERHICRRPHHLVTLDMLRKNLKEIETIGEKIPETWDLRRIPTNSDGDKFELCKLDKNSEEYESVAELFGEENKKYILKVERVQNIELWVEFARKRNKMMDSHQTSDASDGSQELLLFHGMDGRLIKAICQQNFDNRISGSNVGTKYGQGCYFSKSAKYSHRYATPDSASNRQSMFLVRVLAGSFVVGNPTYRRPPSKDPSNPLGPLYDSCVDSVKDPLIFVIFDSRQVYPEYLITYKVR